MKLVMAIVSNDDSSKVSGKLSEQGFGVTRLATTGGFLMSGNTTLLIGTEDDKVDAVISIISENSKRRTRMMPSSASYGAGVYTSFPMEVSVGGGTIFVLNVDRFEKV